MAMSYNEKRQKRAQTQGMETEKCLTVLDCILSV